MLDTILRSIFGKSCGGCGVQIPRKANIVDNEFCSEKCSEIDDQLYEIVIKNYDTLTHPHRTKNSIESLNDFDRRRAQSLIEEMEKNKIAMERLYHNA